MPGTRYGNNNKNKKNAGNNSTRGVKRGAAGSNRKTTKSPKELSGFDLFIQKAKDKLCCDPFPTRAHEVVQVNCLNRCALLIIIGALLFTNFVLVCIGTFVINARKEDPRPNDTFSADILSFSVVLLIVGLTGFSFTLCGFVGVLRENIILIRVFYLSLIVLISIKLLLLLFVLFFTSTARSIVGNAISDSIVLNYRDNTDIEATMDYMQSTFNCCGLRENGFKDWSRSIYFNCSDSNPSAERCGVPWSCCRNSTGLKNNLCGSGVQRFDRNIASRVIYTRSCLLALQKWCKTHALAVTVLLILEAVFIVIVIFQCTHMVNELQMMTHVYRGPWWDWVCRKKSKIKPMQNACEAGNSVEPTSVPEIVVEVPQEKEDLATPMNTYPRGIKSNINETKFILSKPSIPTDKGQSLPARKDWQKAPAIAVLQAAADKVELEEVDLKTARKSVDADRRRSSGLPPVGSTPPSPIVDSTPKAEAEQKNKTGSKALEKEYVNTKPKPEEKRVSWPEDEIALTTVPLSDASIPPDSSVHTPQETEKYPDVKVRQNFEQRKSVPGNQEPTPPRPQKERQRSVPDKANLNDIPTSQPEKAVVLEPNVVVQSGDDLHKQSTHMDTLPTQRPSVVNTKHGESSTSSSSSDEHEPAVLTSYKRSKPVHPPKRAQRKSRRKTEIIKNTRNITKKEAEKKQKRLSRARRETIDVTNSSEDVAAPDQQADAATLPAWLDGEYKYKYKRATLTPSEHEDTKAPEGRRGDGGSVSKAVSMELNAALNNPAAHDEVESTRLMTGAVNLMRNSPSTNQDTDQDKDEAQPSTLGPHGLPEDDW